MPIKLVKKVLQVWKNDGLDMVFYKIKLKMDMRNVYSTWISRNERKIQYIEKLSYNPFISVVIPVYNVEEHMLRECINSVLDQTYKNYEIILVDDASTQKSVRNVLREYQENPRITVIYRKENGHISRATNDGIKAAKGQFIAFCDCDDLYAPNALYEVAKKLNEDNTLDYIYSDEDKISENGKIRRDPFFKPDWSPQTFMSYMYPCHLSVFRKTILETLSGLRPGFEGAQDYDLVLRVMEITSHIGHIPKILYHWRMRKESTASALTAKPYILESTIKAKKEALERRGELGTLTLIPDIGQYRVTYIPKGNPLVSIIIPSKDNPTMLSICLNSILKNTDYDNYEIIIVDNGSLEKNKKKIERLIDGFKESESFKNITYFYHPMDFNFSKMCNIGAFEANGEYLLFLNDDIEISESVKQNPHLPKQINQWLSILVGQAQVSYTGAVGCKLYYPNSIQLQHAGILNLQIGPGHCLYGENDNLNYYYGRNLLDYNFCAVTGACLVIARNKFNEAGGFDEELPVAYNDVALCFKLLELGYYNVIRNDVALVHHESVSRGLDDESKQKEERRKREMQKLYKKHPQFIGGYDPCYNPNLTPDRGDFSFNMNRIHLPEKALKLNGKMKKKYHFLASIEKPLVFHIDLIEQKKNTVKINGWIYNCKKRNNNHNKVKLFLKRETGEMFIINAEKKIRTDLMTTKGKYHRLLMAGFEAYFTKKGIPKGKYKIGIGINKIYTMSNQYLEINKN